MNELLTMLDTKYKRLEYIQSSGTQYIDTGYKPNNNTRVVTEFYTNVQNVQQFIFGGGRGLASNCFICQIHYTPSQYIRAWYGNSYSQGFDFDINSFHKIDFDKNKFYLDGELKETITQETFQSEYNMAIFSYIQYTGVSSNYFYGKMKYFQIYDNGTLVRNFVPVLRKSDNEIGMLDLVEGKFYGNAGTGKFTANLDTMYALIQGTPTVQDGRVSGFSSGNYLTISKLPLNPNNWEIDICVKSISSSPILTTKNIGLTLSQSNSGISIYLSSTSSSSYDIANNLLVPILSNNKGWVKIQFTGSQYIISYSLDGISYTTAHTINKNLQVQELFTNPIEFGRQWLSNRYYDGSIDLNRSYIKIDDTKYKLQAVLR